MIFWVPPIALSLGQFPLLFPQQSFCSLWSLSLLSILLSKLRSAVAGCLLLSDPRLDLRIRVIPPPTPTSSNLQLSSFHWTFFFGYKYVFNERVFHKKKKWQGKSKATPAWSQSLSGMPTSSHPSVWLASPLLARLPSPFSHLSPLTGLSQLLLDPGGGPVQVLARPRWPGLTVPSHRWSPLSSKRCAP